MREDYLDDVRAELARTARRVVDRVERVLAALGLDRGTARVRPDDQRHTQAYGVGPYLAVLLEVTLLRGRPDVEGVSDGVSAEPDGVLDRRVQRRERFSVGRDVGLAVQLQDERHFAGVVPVELLGQADLHDDAVAAALLGQLDD